MCVAVPGIVTRVLDEDSAEIEIGGAHATVSTVLLHRAVLPGDYLLAHAGYAIACIDTEQAERTLALWDQVNEHPV